MQRFSILLLTLVSAAFAFGVAEPLADRLEPNWREQLVLDRGETPNPLLKTFAADEMLRTVDLEHAAAGEYRRRPESLWHMLPFAPANFSDRYDVIFYGDSTITWGLDVKTVAKTSGLKVGLIGFEGNMFGFEEAEFMTLIASCLLKKDGRLLTGFAWPFLVARGRLNRTWNAEQTQLVEQTGTDCAAFEEKLRRTKPWSELPAPPRWMTLDFATYQKARDAFDERALSRLPAHSPRVSVRSALGLDPVESSGNEGARSTFFAHDDDATHRVNDYKWPREATLSADWAAPLHLDPTSKQTLTERYLPVTEAMKSTNHCFLIHITQSTDKARRREAAGHVAAWQTFGGTSCLMNLSALVLENTGRATVKMQGTRHMADETGEIVSVALGRELKKNAALAANGSSIRRHGTD